MKSKDTASLFGSQAYRNIVLVIMVSSICIDLYSLFTRLEEKQGRLAFLNITDIKCLPWAPCLNINIYL